MNKKRQEKIKKAVESIRKSITALESITTILDTAKGEIDIALSEEQDAYDNMIDAMKDGNAGSVSEQFMDELPNVISEVEDLIDNLDTYSLTEAVNSLESLLDV